ncbi:MAG: MoaD/ThiS family protein [Bacillota bacterium]|nr:MoaD/ThiS family protein [Bacillota bacterium]
MMNPIEVRAFGDLQGLFNERGWPFPLLVNLPEPMTAEELAIKLNIPLDKIEAVFLNGRAVGVDHLIQAGDRVAFVPPGTPGPYRLLLGFTART